MAGLHQEVTVIRHRDRRRHPAQQIHLKRRWRLIDIPTENTVFIEGKVGGLAVEHDLAAVDEGSGSDTVYAVAHRAVVTIVTFTAKDYQLAILELIKINLATIIQCQSIVINILVVIRPADQHQAIHGG